MRKAYLVLRDGQIFEGEGFGSDTQAEGRLVFNTGVVGYIESLSDPACAGQIVVQTFPQLGNYGVNSEDMESPCCRAAGVVVREWCAVPSNFRSEESVDDFLKRCGVPGICGVDTRQIVRSIRRGGVMPALILRELPDAPAESLFASASDAGAMPRAAEPETLRPGEAAEYKVAVIDCGLKKSLALELLSRRCELTLFPRGTAAGRILESGFDGVLISGGPEERESYDRRAGEIKPLLGKLPILGLCLGHQLLAVAAGGGVISLKCGHRGSNQPVRELSTGLVRITAQNHGSAVGSAGLDKIGARLSHVNLNDGSCEGLLYPGAAALSLQYQPEPGSRVYDSFIELMAGGAV